VRARLATGRARPSRAKNAASAAPAARGNGQPPSLTSIHPSAARWIGALIRMSSPHPAMTRILDIVERLQDAPYRTSFLLLGEPGTGKAGLARALHHLCAPGTPLVRLDVAGFPEDEALAALCGAGKRPGAAERADGGFILIDEIAGLGPRTQAALLDLLKSGACERAGASPSAPARRLRVNAIAMSDRDLEAELDAGRFRHDLFYTLARVVLWLPPLRERLQDIAPAAVWTGNRILRAAGLDLELLGAADFTAASAEDRRRAIELRPDAIQALEGHVWTGNFRELETVLERALMLYRRGRSIGAPEIRAALDKTGAPPAPRAPREN